MATQWYYQSDGNEEGPIEATDLKRLVQEGVIGEQTPIRRSDMEQLVLAKQVKGLFAAAPAAAAPAPAAAAPAPAAPARPPAPAEDEYDDDEEDEAPSGRGGRGGRRGAGGGSGSRRGGRGGGGRGGAKGGTSRARRPAAEDPFSAPSEESGGRRGGGGGGRGGDFEPLVNKKGWITFIGVMNIIGGALAALGALLMVFAALAAPPMIIAALLYAGFAFLVLMAGIKAVKASSALGRGGSNYDAAKHLGGFFLFNGILIIITIVGTILAFLAGLAGIAGAATLAQ